MGGSCRLGLATDGDADRLVAVDVDGRVLSSAETAALLVDHLAATGRARRGVAVTAAAGTLVERVAAAHGLAVLRRRIGFKHLAPELRARHADVAADESDGYAWAEFGFDKDGILAGCLLAELVATRTPTLGARLRELEREHGRFAYGRTAVRLDAPAREALATLCAAPPGAVGGGRVRGVDAEDGLRLALEDGFLMVRASGTEPLVRVYAEAPDAVRLRRRLRAGVDLLGGA